MAKKMFGKKRFTLNNEGWTNRKNLISFLAGVLIIPLFVSSFLSYWFVAPLLISCAVFLAINFDFYRFILKEKPNGLLNAFFLNLMVQIVSGLGIITGLAGYLKEKGSR